MASHPIKKADVNLAKSNCRELKQLIALIEMRNMSHGYCSYSNLNWEFMLRIVVCREGVYFPCALASPCCFHFIYHLLVHAEFPPTKGIWALQLTPGKRQSHFIVSLTLKYSAFNKSLDFSFTQVLLWQHHYIFDSSSSLKVWSENGICDPFLRSFVDAFFGVVRCHSLWPLGDRPAAKLRVPSWILVSAGLVHFYILVQVHAGSDRSELIIIWTLLSVASCDWRDSDSAAASHQPEVIPLHFLPIQLVTLNLFLYLIIIFYSLFHWLSRGFLLNN